jgi:phosphoserine phosphatase
MKTTKRSTQDVQNEQTVVAFIYDFDGTLAPGNMHEHYLLPKLGITPDEFWAKSDALAENKGADNNLAYMWLTLQLAKDLGIKKSDFQSYGKEVSLFKGVNDWFERINTYGESLGIKVEHYIISSGLHEMLEGMDVAKNFKKIYANRFMYNEDGIAYWPARIMNYTDKTQCLFRISKGCLDEADRSVNDKSKDFRIEFKNMLYFGDGLTDVPCMAILQKNGGHSIGVYSTERSKKTAEKLLADQRVNIIASADYSEEEKIDSYVKALLNKIHADEELYNR